MADGLGVTTRRGRAARAAERRAGSSTTASSAPTDTGADAANAVSSSAPNPPVASVSEANAASRAARALSRSAANGVDAEVADIVAQLTSPAGSIHDSSTGNNGDIPAPHPVHGGQDAADVPVPVVAGGNGSMDAVALSLGAAGSAAQVPSPLATASFSPARIAAVAMAVSLGMSNEMVCPLSRKIAKKDDMIKYGYTNDTMRLCAAKPIFEWLKGRYETCVPPLGTGIGTQVTMLCPLSSSPLNLTALGHRRYKRSTHYFDDNMKYKTLKLIAVYTKRLPSDIDAQIEAAIREAVRTAVVELEDGEDEAALREATARYMIDMYHSPTEPTGGFRQKIYSIRQDLEDYMHPRYNEFSENNEEFSQSETEVEYPLQTPRRYDWPSDDEGSGGGSGGGDSGNGSGSGSGGGSGDGADGAAGDTAAGGGAGGAVYDVSSSDDDGDDNGEVTLMTLPDFDGLTGRGPRLMTRIMQVIRDAPAVTANGPAGYGRFPRAPTARTAFLESLLPTWREQGGILHRYRNVTASNVLRKMNKAFAHARRLANEATHSTDASGADGEVLPPYYQLVQDLDAHHSSNSNAGARRRNANRSTEQEQMEPRAPLGGGVEEPRSQVGAENAARDSQRRPAGAATAPGSESMAAAMDGADIGTATMSRRTVLDQVNAQRGQVNDRLVGGLERAALSIANTRPPTNPADDAIKLASALTQTAMQRQQMRNDANGQEPSPSAIGLLDVAGAMLSNQAALSIGEQMQQLHQQQLMLQQNGLQLPATVQAMQQQSTGHQQPLQQQQLGETALEGSETGRSVSRSLGSPKGRPVLGINGIANSRWIISVLVGCENVFKILR